VEACKGEVDNLLLTFLCQNSETDLLKQSNWPSAHMQGSKESFSNLRFPSRKFRLEAWKMGHILKQQLP
jgi:hypothetical protein